ncbi:MAG: SDR family NAD(P)-dependent oxidoreductase [Anaerolineaceae bacterium]|nr:SDR family NAD(P)-dependent oxidoreductase [Anaerolineaceae bacterium]
MKESIQKKNPAAMLITGATGGLGKAFAVECASRGWNLFLTDLDEKRLELLEKNLSQTYNVEVNSYACDLTDENTRRDMFKYIHVIDLQLHGLINVAGGDYEGLFYEQPADKVLNIVRLNVEATLAMIYSSMAFRDPAQTFRIINVASLAAFYPMPVKATYAASKRFLLDFSLALRNEVKEMDATVTVLCPAGMPTTRECISSIDAQGLMGQLTTLNTGSVANQTLNAALKGKAVVIPGLINQALQIIGSILPRQWVAGLIGWRWKNTRKKYAAG